MVLRRLREFLWPSPSAPQLPEGLFISKALASDIEEIMPGETLVIVMKDRKFVILEQEEFDVILERAGMRHKPGSGTQL